MSRVRMTDAQCDITGRASRRVQQLEATLNVARAHLSDVATLVFEAHEIEDDPRITIDGRYIVVPDAAENDQLP